jgi:hypothetical protein
LNRDSVATAPHDLADVRVITDEEAADELKAGNRFGGMLPKAYG